MSVHLIADVEIVSYLGIARIWPQAELRRYSATVEESDLRQINKVVRYIEETVEEGWKTNSLDTTITTAIGGEIKCRTINVKKLWQKDSDGTLHLLYEEPIPSLDTIGEQFRHLLR